MERNLTNSEMQGEDHPPAPQGPPVHFLALTEQDLRPWRDHPVSRLLEAHLRRECEVTQRHIARLIAGNNIPQARIATGGLLVVESLISAMHPYEPPPPEPEEPFVDPAEIIRPKVRP